MLKTIFRILVILAILGVIVAGTLLLADYIITRERFPKNTFAGNVDLSFLNQEEAISKLNKIDVDYACADSIVLTYDSRQLRFLPSELGIYIKPYSTVRRAMNKTRSKSYLKDLSRRLKNPGRFIPVVLGVREDILQSVLEDLANKINQDAQDAKVAIYGPNKHKVFKERVGIELLVDKSINQIQDGLKEDRRNIALAVKVTEPRITFQDLASYPPVHLLGKYTTYFGSHNSPNRIHNIKEIAEKISGKILLSNESFSLIKAVGSFEAASGLKEAFVIKGDELVPEYGGGSCQIATTLYNSVIRADLKVVRRRNHSIWFNIYPLGRDATVYPPYTDFKFKNDSGYPIYIQAITSKRNLTFKIFGTPTGKSVYFSGLNISYKNDEDKWESHSKIPEDDRPFRTQINRIVKKGGKIIEKEKIESFYKMVGDREYVKIKRPEPRN